MQLELVRSSWRSSGRQLDTLASGCVHQEMVDLARSLTMALCSLQGLCSLPLAVLTLDLQIKTRGQIKRQIWSQCLFTLSLFSCL